MPSQASGPLLRPGESETLATNAAKSQSPAPYTSFAAALQAAADAGSPPLRATMRSETMPGAEPGSAPSAQTEATAGAESEPAPSLESELARSPEPEPVPSAEPEPPPSAEVEPMPDIETQTAPDQAPYAAEVNPYAAATYGVGTRTPTASATLGYGQATPGYAIPGAPTQLAAESQAALASGQSPGAGLHPYEALIRQAALRNGVEPALLRGLIEQESGFDPNARSSAGALGLTQLMPSTAASLGVRNPLDPTEAVEGGARLLGELLRQFGGNVSDALAAYNAGAGAVHRYGGVPPYPETEAYVSKVLANAQSFRRGA